MKKNLLFEKDAPKPNSLSDVYRIIQELWTKLREYEDRCWRLKPVPTVRCVFRYSPTAATNGVNRAISSATLIPATLTLPKQLDATLVPAALNPVNSYAAPFATGASHTSPAF